MLSCHEDVLADKACVYGLERCDAPGPFTRRLLQSNLRHFERHPGGHVDNCPVDDGAVFNQFDSSFEQWMISLGVHAAACVETPALQGFAHRVAAQADRIEAFAAGSGAAGRRTDQTQTPHPRLAVTGNPGRMSQTQTPGLKAAGATARVQVKPSARSFASVDE